MKLYHKIETIFSRDMEGSKKLIEGKFRDPLVEYLKDNEWLFTEKIDGMNIRIIWDGYNVSFSGRTERAELPRGLTKRLEELFGGNINEQLFEQTFGEKEVVLFGEGYGGKIQEGSDYKKVSDFILFDVWVSDVYLERENVEEIAKIFNLDVVPIIPVKTINEAIDFIKTKPKSLIGDKEMEGVVGIPKVRLLTGRGDRVIIKLVVRDLI